MKYIYFIVSPLGKKHYVQDFDGWQIDFTDDKSKATQVTMEAGENVPWFHFSLLKEEVIPEKYWIVKLKNQEGWWFYSSTGIVVELTKLQEDAMRFPTLWQAKKTCEGILTLPNVTALRFVEITR